MTASLHKKIIMVIITISLIIHSIIFANFVQASDIADTTLLGNGIKTQALQNTNTINPQTAISNLVNTGDNVKFQANNEAKSKTEVKNNNDASINQSVDASANTGNNEASRNISIGGNAGIINTGDAAVNVTGIANANNNTTGVLGSNGAPTTESLVTNTGDGLTSTTSSSSDNKTFVSNGNTTTVNQSADTSANTGDNKADRNISIGGQAGIITTGNASSNTNFLVTANGSVALVGGDSNGNGPGSGASIVLTNTGDRGKFGSSADQKKFTIVNNDNSAYINQSCGSSGLSCSANTGNNTSDRGIAFGGNAGAITTQDANVNLVLYANANKNTTAVDNGGSNGPISQSGIVNTGDKTSSNTSTSDNNTVGVSNGNDAQVNQHANADANTGNNRANRNISIGGDAGVINTGNARVNVIMIADVNSNGTAVNNSNSGSGNGIANALGFVNTGNDASVDSNSSSNNKTGILSNNVLDVLQNAAEWVSTGLNSTAGNVSK